MIQTIELPAGPCAEESQRHRPQSVSSTLSAKGSPSASDIAERDHEGASLIDMFKVVAFLVLAIVARSALTDQDTSHVEGVSEPPVHVQSQIAAATPDLIDLSTVGF